MRLGSQRMKQLISLPTCCQHQSHASHSFEWFHAEVWGQTPSDYGNNYKAGVWISSPHWERT